MKKIMTLVLAIVLLATLCLTGCQPADKPTDSTKGTVAPTNKPTETTEPQLEEKTIQIWLGGAGMQKDTEKVWKAFNELLQQYVPNTTVEFTIFPMGEYKEKYTQMIAAEEDVDLAWGMWTISKPQEIKDGNIIALDDLIANYGKDIVEVLGQGALDAHKWSDDGKIYFIPSWQGLYGYRHGITVPTELANLAGASWAADTQAAMLKYTSNVPTAANLNAVLDQLEIFFEAAKKAGKLGAGWQERIGGFGYVNGVDYGAISAGAHLKWADNSFAVEYMYTTETSKAYFQRLASWYDKGYIRSDYASAEGLHEPKDGKIDDQTFIITHNGWNSDADDEAKAATWGMPVTTMTWTDHGSIIQGYSTGMMIPYSADEPERAMMVLNAIYGQKDLYNLLVYGIEGEHYTKNADGTIKTEYEGASPTTENAYGMQRWVIGSCKNAYINNGTAIDFYTKLEALETDPKTVNNPFVPLVLDATKFENEVAAINAVNTKYGAGKNVWLAGSAGWEAVWNAWMKELDDAGVAKYEAELQKQVDAFVKTNNVTAWP